MRSRLRRQTNYLHLEKLKDLESVLREMKDVAEASSEELLTQNLSVLKDVLSAWKKGRVSTITSEVLPSSQPNSSFQNVFTDDPSDLIADYDSPYFIQNDSQ